MIKCLADCYFICIFAISNVYLTRIFYLVGYKVTKKGERCEAHPLCFYPSIIVIRVFFPFIFLCTD